MKKGQKRQPKCEKGELLMQKTQILQLFIDSRQPEEYINFGIPPLGGKERYSPDF